MLGALLSCAAIGQQAPVASAAAQTEVQEFDEIQIQGRNLWELRMQMVAVEDRFYALYNRLNTDDDFDVHCVVRGGVSRDTHINYRVCEVEYVLKAQAAAAQAGLDAQFFGTRGESSGLGESGIATFAGSGGNGPVAGGAAMPVRSVTLGRADEYRNAMLAVVNRSPELRHLVQERQRLGKRYEEVRLERAGWRWFGFK